MTRIVTVVAVFSLLGMALLPTVESLSRIGIGIPPIPGSEGFVLLATLWVAFLGAILAARDKRLLALSQEVEYSDNQPVSLRTLYSNTMTFVLVSVMTYASAGFVLENFAAETKSVPAPFWVVAVIIPIGFALITTSVFLVSPRNILVRGSMIFAIIIVSIMGYFELFTQPQFFLDRSCLDSCLISYGCPHLCSFRRFIHAYTSLQFLALFRPLRMKLLL